MFFHAGVTIFGGGFLGVDVFFALSGFLITTLLLAEIDRSDRINLGSFWKRRALRLLPAIGAMMLVVLVVLPLLGIQWPSATRGDAVATFFYVTNWWFIAQNQPYVQAFSDPSPFQHMWSLAIEEQFYLIFPLILLALIGTFALRGGRRSVGYLLLGGSVLSAAWMAILFSNTGDVTRAYYGTDTRCQTLLLGCAAACLVSARRRAHPDQSLFSSRTANVAGIAGIGALLVLAMTVRESTNWMYYGGYFLVAVLSVAVILSLDTGLKQSNPLSRGLSLRPVVFIGTISYGLYVWHWPLFLALNSEHTGLNGIALFALRFAVTFAVAIASWYLLEQPMRSGRLLDRTVPTSSRAFVALAGTAAVIAAIAFTNSAPRVDDISQLQIVAEQLTASSAPHSSPTSHSTSTTKSKVTNIQFVGDSRPLSLFVGARDIAKPAVNLTVATRFGCGVTPMTAAVEGTPVPPIQPLCGQWENARAYEIAMQHPTISVLFPGTWERYDRWVGGATVPSSSQEWQDLTAADYGRVLKEMHAQTNRVGIVLDSCTYRPAQDLGGPANVVRATAYAPVVNSLTRRDQLNAAARKAAADAGFPVTVIDINPWLCPHGFQPTLDGVKLRTDGVHFTVKGAQLVWKRLEPELLKIGAEKNN